MKTKFVFILACFMLAINHFGHCQMTPAKYVNPFIGTGGHGHTYPGATVPFGMVQLSPDTRLEGWDGCGGYHYSDEFIYGFSHTHLSGTGIPDYGDILIMPFTGDDHWNNGFDGKAGYRSHYSHNNETASPGYYQVLLLDNNINVELTATARTGLHSYTFPKGVTQKIIIDLEHRDKVTNSWFKVISPNEIEGYRGSTAWADDQRLYFVIKFSKPIANQKVALDNKLIDATDVIEGKSVKTILEFGNSNGDPLLIKVALSAVSTQNARLNMDTESQQWNFTKIKNNAENWWNKELRKIEAKSDDIDKLTVFYTSLYHTMVVPNIYNDVNGDYLGRDFKIHNSNNDYYTVFSLWDTYRAYHPLMTIIDRKRTADFINTFLTQYEEGGLLPVWEFSSNETWCMIGYHAVPVIADAYLKGIKGFDEQKALQAIIKSAEQDQFGLKYYKEFGYIPADKEHESVSKTLEYSYDDWCIAKMAEAIGKNDVSKPFYIRAQGYKHLFDNKSGFMRARYNGAWFNPFDPREVNFNYTEANSWQYSFYVPHDMDTFTKMLNGKKGLESKLDSLFSAPQKTTGREQSDITGLIGQYAHGNEPSHHIAYLYNFAEKPWKTQEKINYIMNNFYSNKPDGLIGNEDCGQMSAWAVLSALGFYPVCPGSNQYVIGKPLFDEAVINLENGKKFIIKANNLSAENIYIASATLNGKEYSKSFLMHSDIEKGGVIVFKMSNRPDFTWGTGEGNAPKTGISQNLITVAPIIENNNQLFDNQASVSITSYDGATIHYTIDDSEPDESSLIFNKPLIFNESTTLKFKGYKAGFIPSSTQVSKYIKRPQGIELILQSEYAPQYSGNGQNTLIDGIKGSDDFRLGGWQGYEGKDLIADIILSSDKPVTSLEIGFFQDINAWIFMPEKVELWSSAEGKFFKQIATISNDVPANQWGVVLKQFAFNSLNIKDRYLRIKAISIKTCPPEHKGSGYPAWIFSDEISITY
ncbi:MAG TPA: GH92 family glycosyl hydrolase [Lentimicrobium sp.]|nr:GH92 family glycosyl hydrolase [Lentimicrobium sp.]